VGAGREIEVELAPGIRSLSQKKGGRVHAFLLDDGNGLTLIDTLYDTDGQRVLDEIAAMGRSVDDLESIILTHGHRSHLGGARALKEQSGAAVYAHEWEADIVAGERKAQPVSLVPQRPLRAYFPLQVGLALGLGKHPPCPVDHGVSDGDRIGPLEVFHAPGHSPGHLVFSWPERRALFAGDAIATWPELSAGWPAFNLNPTQHRESLRRMAEFDSEVLAVGHGEPIRTEGKRHVRDLVDGLAR
jgi:glyoxylase-like metal-dependent hydrolase (beta-lactamase superfamily II)